jgi:hypothetical protein
VRYLLDTIAQGEGIALAQTIAVQEPPGQAL